jgi:two-component system sensor histidine kinase AlgZ
VLLAAVLRLLTPRPWLDALVFAVPAALIYGFAVLSAWWVCRANPLSGGLSTLAAQLGAALQASALWTGAAALLGVLIARAASLGPGPPGILRDLATLFVIGIPFYLLSAVVHYLLIMFEASHAAEKSALESRVSAREAELRALRAQLNPHFLFNSLNSINALVGIDPEGARRMCEGLGDFLRRTLALGARESVPLGEELALVDRYLDIEQVRFGDRLRVERGVDPAVLDWAVPPLLLQPLVENAIKHGVQDAVEGGAVRLEARREGDLLVLTVENPFDADAPARRGEGVGLENVRRRLAAFGTHEARLVAGRVGERFRVRLELPAPHEARGGSGG